VGLNTGSLRIYRLNEPTNDISSPNVDDRPASASVKPTDLLREEEKFSKYKIEQLAPIKEANALLSLSNGLVSIHDLSTYQPQETLSKSKGASCFAVTSDIVKDGETGVPSIVSRLAVAVKRRLILWSWHDSEMSSETREITLVTGIRTLTWASGSRLVAGLTSSYVLVDVETSAITDLAGPGSIGGGPVQDVGRLGGVGVAGMGYMGMGSMIPKPLATRLREGCMLLAKDINTLFIDAEGNPLGRRQIPWPVAPEAIGCSYPFLLALQPTKGILEVRNPETLTALQSIPLPNANQLHIPNPSVSLAHAGKGFFVSGERCVWRMDASGYDAQIDDLVEKKKYDEAISLLGMLEDALLKDKDRRMREIKMLKAQELFDTKQYRESLDLFGEVTAPPERVISLYPAIIAGEKMKEKHPATEASNAAEGADEEITSSSAAAETRSIRSISDRASVKGRPEPTSPKRTSRGYSFSRALLGRFQKTEFGIDLLGLCGTGLS
jgi:Vam6/Vps39-like protein vacuolar protein sorting-associated protein 39